MAINTIRYKKRQQEEEWIQTFLERAAYGTLAMTLADGQPIVNMNIFAYDRDANAIYFHTAHQGQTHDTIASGLRTVCFSVAEMGRIIPADRALNFSVEYSGVVVFGEVMLIEDSDMAKYAFDKIMQKYAPHLKPDVDYEATTDDDLKRTSVYSISITQWSGKKRPTPPEDSNAYDYYKVIQTRSS